MKQKMKFFAALLACAMTISPIAAMAGQWVPMGSDWAYMTDDGEETSTKSIKAAMEELISNEDKSKPLSDEAIAQMMAEKGYPIARRTVAKYREKLGIPVARMRR